jgi:hypothetical protein
MDFMQNLPLPRIPAQEKFYFRQLWVHVFEINNLRNNKSVFIYNMKGKLRQDRIKYVPFYWNGAGVAQSV